MNFLIRLHPGYGLGDSVAMSAVLRHVVKHLPGWHIDYQAEEGRHQVGRGIVTNTFASGQPYPSDHYDAEVLITLFERWKGYRDRPNTRVSYSLKEHFGLEWNPDLARYQVEVSHEAEQAAMVLSGIGCKQGGRGAKHGTPRQRYGGRVVAIHYQGITCKPQKDLTHAQAATICRYVEKLGCTPLLLDWRDESPLVHSLEVRTVGRTPRSREFGTSAEMNAAVIAQCAAFVGIDSGPAKCASATDTPSLVVWTGHSPLPFHDPAPNTTHLIPVGYNGLSPKIEDQYAIDWFEANYKTRWYSGDPVVEVGEWLRETLA